MTIPPTPVSHVCRLIIVFALGMKFSLLRITLLTVRIVWLDVAFLQVAGIGDHSYRADGHGNFCQHRVHHAEDG